ncbi:hypothetical protein [Ornithinimicrobium sp. W1665]|uniref:hypothetical protein n=1 Tax=Ornithinimicrobium sp. W1665 TaxID=3416666 RepID=UPI003CFA8C1A
MTRTTKNAPARCCNTGQGLNHPTTNQEVSKSMTIIPDGTDSIKTPEAWMQDPATDVAPQRGEGVHPDDYGAYYDRFIDEWVSTPSAAHISYDQLRVSVGAFVNDHGPRESLTEVSVYVDSVAEVTVTAIDARRLGQALITAADLIEGRPAATFPLTWQALNGGTYRITNDGDVQSYQAHADEWRRCADLTPRSVDDAAEHYQAIAAAMQALGHDGEVG